MALLSPARVPNVTIVDCAADVGKLCYAKPAPRIAVCHFSFSL